MATVDQAAVALLVCLDRFPLAAGPKLRCWLLLLGLGLDLLQALLLVEQLEATIIATILPQFLLGVMCEQDLVLLPAISRLEVAGIWVVADQASLHQVRYELVLDLPHLLILPLELLKLQLLSLHLVLHLLMQLELGLDPSCLGLLGLLGLLHLFLGLSTLPPSISS